MFAINNALAEAKRALNPRRSSRRTASTTRCSRARSTDATVGPADLAALPGPRIGFYGTLRDWVDFELIAHVARKRPSGDSC